MEVIIHNRIEALREIIPEYNELKRKFSEIMIFQEVQFLTNWWNNNCKTIEMSPYIVVVKCNNETVGILPLYASEKKFSNIKFCILRPMGFMDGAYLIPILSKKHSSDEILKKVMTELNKEKKNWDCIHWADLPEGSNLDVFLKNQIGQGKQ